MTSCQRPIPAASDREAIAAAVNGFHDALAKGDEAAALALLAEDAQILESGERQTREEYAREHLPADINFAKAVPSIQFALIVRQEGDAAWTTATSQSKGTFSGREINTDGAELMVLHKTSAGWRIRAIHWSGHPHR
ncbi:MAG: nuclear transport factor 2 family protein [Chthoniobacterales bacterium]